MKFKIASKSTPGQFHTITVTAHGRGCKVSCTCRGNHTHGHCWHLEEGRKRYKKLLAK